MISRFDVLFECIQEEVDQEIQQIETKREQFYNDAIAAQQPEPGQKPLEGDTTGTTASTVQEPVKNAKDADETTEVIKDKEVEDEKI